MAVDVKASNMKADLLKIAAENGIEVNESMTKAQIIDAINAQDGTEQAASAPDTQTAVNTPQTATDTAEQAASDTDTGTAESTPQTAAESVEQTENGTDTGTATNAPQTATDSTEQSGGESTQQSAQTATFTAEAPATTDNTTTEENAAESGTEDENSEYNMFAYIGPSLPRGLLKENAVFRGKIKDVLNYLVDALEEYPQVEKLIVPTHKLAEYSAKARTPGNVVHKYYNDIVSAMHGNREV